MSETSGKLEVPEWATAGLAEATRLSDEILRRGSYNHQIDYEVAGRHWRVEVIVEEERISAGGHTMSRSGLITIESWVDRGFDEWEFRRNGRKPEWLVGQVKWTGKYPLQVPPPAEVMEGEGMRR